MKSNLYLMTDVASFSLRICFGFNTLIYLAVIFIMRVLRKYFYVFFICLLAVMYGKYNIADLHVFLVRADVIIRRIFYLFAMVNDEIGSFE